MVIFVNSSNILIERPVSCGLFVPHFDGSLMRAVFTATLNLGAAAARHAHKQGQQP